MPAAVAVAVGALVVGAVVGATVGLVVVSMMGRVLADSCHLVHGKCADEHLYDLVSAFVRCMADHLGTLQGDTQAYGRDDPVSQEGGK